MLPQYTIAIYCCSTEDAANAAEWLQMPYPRLFIVVSDESECPVNWLNPKDVLLYMPAGLDGAIATAARCAMLFAPSFNVVFVDASNLNSNENVDCGAIMDKVNQYGWVQLGNHWGITKQYAAQYGFPGSAGFAQPPAPGDTGLTAEAVVDLLIDLVPMFEVHFAPNFNLVYPEIRRALDHHTTSFNTDKPSVIYITASDDLTAMRKKVKITGKVVCVGGDTDGFDHEFAYNGYPVRIYSADSDR